MDEGLSLEGDDGYVGVEEGVVGEGFSVLVVGSERERSFGRDGGGRGHRRGGGRKYGDSTVAGAEQDGRNNQESEQANFFHVEILSYGCRRKSFSPAFRRFSVFANRRFDGLLLISYRTGNFSESQRKFFFWKKFQREMRLYTVKQKDKSSVRSVSLLLVCSCPVSASTQSVLSSRFSK